MKTLLIGGARSGKSSMAAGWALGRSSDVCCLVTATASDPEMTRRIAAHRSERPSHWAVREEPLHLGCAVREESHPGTLLLIDCLSLWTANCLWPASSASDGQPDLQGWRREKDDFVAALRLSRCDLIIVSNEVGTGIVPANAAARLFRDEHGWLNQVVASACDEVFLVTAGLPLRIKPAG